MWFLKITGGLFCIFNSLWELKKTQKKIIIFLTTPVQCNFAMVFPPQRVAGFFIRHLISHKNELVIVACLFLNSGKASAFRGQCMKMHAMLQLKFMADYGNFAKIIAKFRKSVANTPKRQQKMWWVCRKPACKPPHCCRLAVACSKRLYCL